MDNSEEKHLTRICGIPVYHLFLEEFQEKENLRSLRELKLGQAEYYYLWHEYAIKAAQALRLVKRNMLAESDMHVDKKIIK